MLSEVIEGIKHHHHKTSAKRIVLYDEIVLFGRHDNTFLNVNPRVRYRKKGTRVPLILNKIKRVGISSTLETYTHF